MAKTFQVGDKVAYSAAWLRSVGLYAGDMPHARGTVVAVKTLSAGVPQLVEIEWGNPDIPRKVIAANLTLVSRIAQDSVL